MCICHVAPEGSSGPNDAGMSSSSRVRAAFLVYHLLELKGGLRAHEAEGLGQEQLVHVEKLAATSSAFAAVRRDGSVAPLRR